MRRGRALLIPNDEIEGQENVTFRYRRALKVYMPFARTEASAVVS